MIFSNIILESIAAHLWAVSWQVAILITLIWVLSLVGRKSSSNFRYWLWCIVIVRLCIPVGLILPVHFDLHLKSAVVSQISTMTTEPSAPEKTPPVQSLNTVAAPNPEGLRSIQALEKSATVSPLSITAVFGLVWLTGVLCILTVIIWRVFRLQKRLKTSPVITRPDLREMLARLSRDMGIKRPIHLHYMELERINSPAVSGIINQRIYLPGSIADSWSLEELKPVLLHELAHIRRLDMIVNWLQIALQALYFFHPLVWYANREIRRLREEVCDDLAIHHLGFEKNQYSQSILNIIKNMGRQPVFGSIGIGFTERKNSLKERIERIMSDSYRRYSKMKVSSIAVLLFIGIISVGLASAKSSSEKKADTSKSAQKESEEYSSKVILDLKWGDGPDEIGFNQIDQDKFGPGAFNVNNEGLIYILDSMHSRVIVFDQNGNFVKEFPIEIGWYQHDLGMDIDENNNVWIIDGADYIIHQYTAEGILQKSIKYNPDPGPMRSVEVYISLRNGEILLGMDKIEITKKITDFGKKGESIYEAVKKELSKNKSPQIIGRISKRMYTSPHVTEKGVPTKIKVIEENGTMTEIILEGIETPYIPFLMDEDMHGNAFLEILYPAGERPRQIWKFNPNLELLTKIDHVPKEVITFNLRKDWDIDDVGNIYIMRTSENGVQIIKWSEVTNNTDKEKGTESTSSGNNKSNEIETIIKGIKKGEKNIYSGKGTLYYEHVYLNFFKETDLKGAIQNNAVVNDSIISNLPVSQRHEKSIIEFTFKNEKFNMKKWNFNEKRELPLLEHAYNGEKTDAIEYNTDDKGLIRPMGSIAIGDKSRDYTFKYDPRFFGLNLFGFPTTSFIEKFIEKSNNIEYLGEEKISDIVCKVIKLFSDQTVITLWIAPTITYRTLKIEYECFSPSTKIVIFVHYKKYDNTIYFPDKIVDDSYSKGEYTHHRIIILHNDWVINTELNDNLFEIAFPEGMKIYDERVDKQIVIQKDKK